MSTEVIAAKLARLLPSSGVIALDASPLARRAVGVGTAARLQVLTNGVETFTGLLGAGPCVRPVLTGGVHDRLTDQLLGPIALQAVRRLVTKRFFMSAEAVDPGLGALEASLDSADIKIAMSEQAEETVLVVPSTHLGRRARALSVPWSSIGILVTELDPADPALDGYRDQVEVL